jgi:hypothetical protein
VLAKVFGNAEDARDNAHSPDDLQVMIDAPTQTPTEIGHCYTEKGSSLYPTIKEHPIARPVQGEEVPHQLC